MVDVTKHNFDDITNKIEELLGLCSFVSIDLEFSGLRDTKSRNTISRYDLPSQRYIKQRNLIQNFAMIQFGICLWCYDSEKCEMTAYPFNIWTFPQSNWHSTFLSQSSSLKFLRENGFDFNKLIDDGIDFLCIDGEKKMRENYIYYKQKKQDRVNERKENKTIVQPRTKQDIEFIKDIQEKIKNFIDNKDDEQKEEILELGLVNGFRRLLIYQLIDQNFNDKVVAFKQTNNNKNEKNHDNQNKPFLKKIGVKKICDKDSKKKIVDEQQKKVEQEWNLNVTKSVGVRKIFDLIAKNRCCVLLHNGFLDSMHLFRSFVGNLPFDPCLFTKRLHNLLPFIIDTKFIMKHLFKDNDQIIENFSLSQCFKFFMDNHDDKKVDDDKKVNHDINNKDIDKILKINVCIENHDKTRNSEKEKSYLTSINGKFHEAGYDAYCTGFIFTKIGVYLYLLNNNNNIDKKDLYHFKDEYDINIKNIDNTKLTLPHFVNRLNLSQCFNKHFYVGNKYYINDKFNINLKFTFDENENENENEKYLGCLCGVDYNAINDDCYKMFYSTFNILDNETNQNKTNGDEEIIKFFKQFIDDENRICIFHRGSINAVIKINDITDNEYNEITQSLQSKQPKNMVFIKYIHHKSKELITSYQHIFELQSKCSNKSEKLKVTNNQNNSNQNDDNVKTTTNDKKRNLTDLNQEKNVENLILNEPPSKKQRID